MPALIVVYGHPGAGKSTIARHLGGSLGMPVFDRDDLKDVMFDTLGWSDREWSKKIGAASYELMHLILERLLSSGVSAIAETNFHADSPFVPHLRRLIADHDVQPVEVHCIAPAEVLYERYRKRWTTGGRHPGHTDVDSFGEFAGSVRSRGDEPLRLGGAIIDVDTTDLDTVDLPALGDSILRRVADA